MGQIQAKIDLSNPKDNSLKLIKVEALVDTGALTLCIPQHIVITQPLNILVRKL